MQSKNEFAPHFRKQIELLLSRNPKTNSKQFPELGQKTAAFFGDALHLHQRI
jgi:hypothetical protein